MCWTWGCRSPGTELSVQKCEGLAAPRFSSVIRALHMGACFFACHTHEKKESCVMSRSVVAPSWFKALPQKEQVEAEFYLALIPKTIQWRCIISPQNLWNVTQSSPYHCTADAPQKHMTGEFLHSRPAILNGCWGCWWRPLPPGSDWQSTVWQLYQALSEDSKPF